MNTPVTAVDDGLQPTMVGNPMLAQIRDFIDADAAPPALDPVGIVHRALRGRERRVAATTLIVAITVSIFAYLLVGPVYQSSGMVRVLAREAKILYSDSDDSRLRLYDAFVTAETELLRSRPVLEAALADLKSRRQVMFPLPNDVGDLSAMLDVRGRKGLISLGARSSDPQLSAAAVNAVLSAYEASNEAARRRHYDVRRDELRSREVELDRNLATLNAEYLEVGAEHDAGTLSKAHITKTAQLEVIEERIAKLDNTIAQLQATGSIGTNVGSIEIQRATLLDQAMADMTYERALRMAALETLKGRYRPSHQKLRAAQGELSVLEGAIAERRGQITALGKAGALMGGSSQSDQESQAELEALKGELQARRKTIRSEAAELNSKLIRIRSIVIEKKRLEELLAETKQALDEVLVESHNDLSRAIEVISRGKVPDGPIEDKRKPAALGAAVFGGLGTLAFFIGCSVFAGRVRYSDDLDQRGSGLLAGVVADTAGAADDLAAAAGKLRNEFDLRWPVQGAQPLVIGVLGVTAGAGATSLASALGRHFAAAGRKVLLIDANAADNGLSQLYAETDTHGALAVVRDGIDLSEAVLELPLETGVMGLLATPTNRSGSLILPGPAELAVDEMQRLLQIARAENDIVVVDLGVLAAGRQSAVGTALADRTVLVAASGERQKNINTTLDLLERLAPDRFLLTLNRGLPFDPALQEATGPGRATTANHPLDRLKNLLKT